MILKTTPRSEHPGGQGGTGDRANGRIREGVVKGQSLGRKFLYMWHGPEVGAIVSKVVYGIVLRNQEHDVRALGGMDQSGEQQVAKGEKGEGDFHGDEVLRR